MSTFDLIVIGGGPAGYSAAERAAREGLSTVLFEKRSLGGVCLNEGCIPSKTLLHSAKIFDYARTGGQKYGVFSDGARIDYDAVLNRKNKVVKTLVSGVSAKMKACDVTVVYSEAVITGKTDDVFEVTANGESYKGRRLLLAVGSEPYLPPVPGLREAIGSGFALTSREIFDLREIPAKLLIVGGGVIGIEMASLFCSLGSEVTVIEMLNRIGGGGDSEVFSLLQKNYIKKGVNFLLNTTATKFSDQSVTVTLDGAEKTLEADKFLVSVGRKAVISGFGLETLGVNVENGRIVTDGQMRTNVPDVYACGDINGKSMLAHTAYRESEVAVNTMLGRTDEVDYDAIPYVVYTNPEAAGIGDTLETAAAKGLNCKEIKLSMRFSGRYLAENEGGDGIAKLIVDSGNILRGAHLIGNPASEIISTVSLALSERLDISSLRKAVFPHPSVAEILRELAFAE